MFARFPVRTKIAAACAALTAIGIVAFATGTLINIYSEQIEAADLELASEARHIAEMMATGEFSRERLQSTQVNPVEPWVAFALVEANGTLWRSKSALPEEVARAAMPNDEPTTVHHAGGNWRVRSISSGSDSVVIGYDLAEAHETVVDLLFAYLVSLPLAGLVAGLGGWWVAGWALRPVRALAQAADAIRAENLFARLPCPKARDEFAHLAGVFNAMLARLEHSFQQAERFAADASHELRTPLTVMRGEIEAMLREERFSARAEQRLVSLQEETDRLDRISDNLLLLARLDAGDAQVERSSVDLRALVTESCEEFEALAAAREVTLETAIEAGACVYGDTDLLRRLTLNLLDNATKFNVPGGRVQCAVKIHGNEVRFSVGNSGAGIPAVLRPRVFERFFRADPARTAKGHGLGLALAREIARAHGGDLSLAKATCDGWTEFVVSIPLSQNGR